jgi:hypothetical protein
MEMADEHLRIAVVALGGRGKSRRPQKCKHCQQSRFDVIGRWDIIQITDLKGINLPITRKLDMHIDCLQALWKAEQRSGLLELERVAPLMVAKMSCSINHEAVAHPAGILPLGRIKGFNMH